MNPAASPFWPMVAELGGSQFAASVDYAGLDMYPDVFGPRFGLGQLDSAVGWLLGSFREEALPIAGIGPAVPIRICENGWPTGPGRSEAQQADVLEPWCAPSMPGATNSTSPTGSFSPCATPTAPTASDMFHQFGVLHDDYSPKPAFGRLGELFAELGR